MFKPIRDVFAGVPIANEYHSVTSTSAAKAITNEIVKTTPGALGSVIITVTGTAPLTIYNATTTNVNLRALATSSLEVLASFRASPTVGTYTYDSVATQGILVVFDSTGTIASTTVTFR